MAIRSENFAKELQAVLDDAGREYTEKTKTVLKKVVRKLRKDIVDRSPEKTGDYKKGWRNKTLYDGPDGYRSVTHNATDYQLTHLLEKPHAKRDGVGITEAQPHIGPAEAAAEAMIEAELTKALMEV